MSGFPKVENYFLPLNKIKATNLHFILKEKEVKPHPSEAETVLDYIRSIQNLKGTKIGCREGDCGACTILVGDLNHGVVRYRSMTSCLMPLVNAHGKHIVTVEGVNFPDRLNLVQQAMADSGATQCGFCTPGFVVSLAGFCLSNQDATKENAIAAIDGNICRCTGYKSIERATDIINEQLKGKNDPIEFVVKNKILPEYFSGIKEKLQQISEETKSLIEIIKRPEAANKFFVGGGTDLYVQRHGDMKEDNSFLFNRRELNFITKEKNTCFLGPAVTVSDLRASEIINTSIPQFQKFSKLVSSTPIRNMATIAGNFVNASPIGDFSIFFLALDAQIELDSIEKKRTIPLRKFYKGYKQLDKTLDEIISRISFELPSKNTYLNFEKISKRTHLDIASVNTAICLEIENGIIQKAGLSAGGVGPIPMFLEKTSTYLQGKKINNDTISGAIETMKTEISPIGDVRGSATYKTLLLEQLIKAHLMPLLNN